MGERFSSLLITPSRPDYWRRRAKEFWKEFKSESARPKLVFGRNLYAQSILQTCSVDGFIDDFSTEPTFCGLPVIRTADIPSNALVLVASGARPLTVRQKLDRLGIEQLDYFCLYKWSEAPLRDIVFNEGFCNEYIANENEYQWIHDRLSDELSRRIFRQLISFRFNCDLDFMTGFSDRQQEQYFEGFLNLQATGEVFVDVGAFDGFTTLEFIKRCPNYRAAYLFEPDPNNFAVCQRKLEGYANVHIWQVGASNVKERVSFTSMGPSSGISADGTLTVELDRLDDLLPVKPTFIKMDIEGGELPAILGAAVIIREHQPRMALSVYHKPGDFWRIPRQVLEIYPNFDVHLRHYTESMYETVMFFLPRCDLVG